MKAGAPDAWRARRRGTPSLAPVAPFDRPFPAVHSCTESSTQSHNRSFAIAIVTAICVALPAFVAAQNYPPSVGQLVASVKKQVKTIDMAEFRTALDRSDAGVLVDVREPDEFADGHIAGAVNVPRGLIEFTIWSYVGFPDKTDRGRKLTLYCKTGGRCALAAKSLQDLGFTNVTAVDMKLEDWVKAGYPLAT